MAADLIVRARAGDGDAFRELTEPYRRELHVHCYRMLGTPSARRVRSRRLRPGRRGWGTLPEGIIAAIKHTLPAEDLAEGFLREQHAWQGQVERPAVLRLMKDGLAAGAQTREGERGLEELYRDLTERHAIGR